MSTATERTFKTLFKDQVNQLSLMEMGESSSLYLQDFHLKSILNILFNEHNIIEKGLDFKLPELQKLAELCIKLLDYQRPNNDSYYIAEVWERCRLTAWRVLILVARQPALSCGDHSVPRMIYNSLEKNLRIPDDEFCQFELNLFMTKAGMSAFCLAQIDLEQILSPEAANKVITDLVLPLAVRCLKEETQINQFTLQDFLDDFHGLDDCHDEVFTRETFHMYPLVIRFLFALKARSSSHQKFKTMLEAIADGGGKINYEDIVVLNVCQAREYVANDPAHEIIMNLLIESDGSLQAHIAFLVWHTDHGILTTDDRKNLFAKIMLDCLTSGNDKLLDEIAIRSFWDRRHQIRGLDEMLAGREVKLVCKLRDSNSSLEIYETFLRHFKRLKASQLVAFETHTSRPISRAIEQLDQGINGHSSEQDVEKQIKISLKCLRHFTQLRSHRLDRNQENKLNTTLSLLTGMHLKCLSPDDADLLIFANSYQVNPIAWEFILKLVRHVLPSMEKCPLDTFSSYSDSAEIAGKDELATAIDIVNMAMSHFLVTDAGHFYGEIGFLEVLELIYSYCERSIRSLKILQSSSVKIILRAILVGWPKNYRETKLQQDQYLIMLNKFIKLAITCFEEVRTSIRQPRKYPDMREEVKKNELLFAIVAAFTFHREALDSVLNELETKDELGDREAWLMDSMKTWTNLVMEDGKQSSPGPFHYFGFKLRADWVPPVWLDEFVNVIIAYEGFKALDELPKLKESSRSMVDATKLALKRGLERAPEDSIESKMYKTRQANLSAVK